MPEHDARARSLLEDAGHKLDATPTAMVADLADVDAPGPDDPEPDAEPSLGDLGRINDRAYGTGDAFQRILGDGPADPRFNYIARRRGEAVASVVSQDHRGDCSIWWVATVPEARGHGLAAGLMRRALADGRARGCDVSTLQATKLGRPVYERLGYRGFGTIEMWERRREPGSRYLSVTRSSNITSPSSVRCTGHLAAICISRSRCSSGSSLGICTSMLKRVGEPRWAGS